MSMAILQEGVAAVLPCSVRRFVVTGEGKKKGSSRPVSSPPFLSCAEYEMAKEAELGP